MNLRAQRRLLRGLIGTDEELLDHVQVVLQTSWLVILCCFAWIGLGLFLDEPLILLISGQVLVGSFLAIALTFLGKPVVARLVWSVSGIVAVTMACFLVHPAGTPQIMYLVLLGGPFLTFSIDREAWLVVLVLGASLLSLASVWVLGHDFFGPPWIGEEIASTYIAPGILLMVMLLVGMEMATFGIMANNYQTRLKKSRQRAQRASQAKTDFLAAMSHEIRTPMNGVVGMVEILENSKLTKEQGRIVETIRDSSTALLTIIEDILDMSRIEAGKLQLSMEKVDLLSVFEKSADTLRPFAESHNVCLTMFFDPRLPRYATCDPGRLRQITLNLLSNAIKFSKRPPDDQCGRATLRVQPGDEGQLEMIITDDGIGIEPEFIADLFTPFEQSKKVTQRTYGGSGLGLAIVAQLVEKFGGSILVESQPGQGASFVVKLPLLDGEGTLPLPDLTGKTVVYYLPSQQFGDYCKKYVEFCGGTFHAITDHKNLAAMALGPQDDTVFMVPFRAPGTNRPDPSGNAAWGFPSGTKALFLTSSRHHLLERDVLNNVVALGRPLLPSVLFSSLAKLFNLNMPLTETYTGNKRFAGAPGARGQRSRILVAEDNEINRIVLQTQLDKLGYSAVLVEDGVEAFDMWKHGDFGLVLTDCQMPKMDGFALTQKIREVEASRGGEHIPIVAITANALRGEAERCIELGMDDYLSKPINLDDLSRVLEQHLAPRVPERKSA